MLMVFVIVVELISVMMVIVKLLSMLGSVLGSSMCYMMWWCFVFIVSVVLISL